MLFVIVLLVAVLPARIGEILTEVGRDYVNGVRPPAADIIESGPRSGAVSVLSRFGDGFDLPCGRGELVIGDTPAETLVINGQWNQTEDIVVINDGVLIVRDADLLMDGDIIVVDGTFLADSSTIIFDQQYLYQYTFIAGGAANFQMSNCTVASNGYPYNFAIFDSAAVTIESVNYKDFTTYALFGEPTLEKRHINLAGEFVVLDSARCTFVDVDTILVWCSMMDSSVIDFTFPGSEPVYDWLFDATVDGVTGVGYSVYCDSVYSPWWGMFSGSGSDVTIRDSEMRSCGIFFEGSSIDTLSGFVNGIDHEDHAFPFSDRTLRFVNTTVETISLYPWQSSELAFSGSIVGEVLTMDQAFCFGQSYYLDGTGGHIEASGNSVNIAALSMITADALARDEGILIIAACSQLWGQNWAEKGSKLFFVQTTTNSMPLAYDYATVGYEFVSGPTVAPLDALVPILGSVWVDGGPDNDVDLVGYKVFYEPPGEETRYQIGQEQEQEVREDTLIMWDTAGLTTGTYSLVVEFYDSLGDTLEGFSPIRLEVQAGAEPTVPGNLGLTAFQEADRLRFVISVPQAGEAELSLYDVGGRRVSQPFKGWIREGILSVSNHPNSSGIYFARLLTGSDAITRKLVFVK